MDIQEKTKEELISELQKLLQENNSLKSLKEKRAAELIISNKELVFQNREKEKRADELVMANKELAYQNEEKEKRAAELITANEELGHQNELKEKRAVELVTANKELVFQNREKEKRADELVMASKELDFQNEEKEKRAAELIIANKELAFQNEEKEKRANELVIANKELAFQNREKEKRADELITANKELAYQNELKEKRAADLVITNKELQQLLQLNEDKDKFFSIITHDLKSPFNSIIGFCEHLMEQIKEKDYEKTGEYANIILQSSKRAMDLLMNLVEWAQSQSGRMDFNPEYFEMASLIDEVTLLLNSIAEQKSIIIVSKVPKDIQVSADKAMISTVLRNLISNAIKFTQPKGRITIEAVVDKQNKLTVSVSDNGVGMANERIDKLFNLNESYSTSGTLNEKGTGFGLILCKEFIERNNGRIWVESEKGKGSTFYFTIPCPIVPDEKMAVQNGAASSKPDPAIEPKVPKLKVLIAEDDEASEMLIDITVKKFGKEILKVRTGIEAVEACQNHQDIDLILMDIKMTEMDGYEATRQIREFNKDVIIIAQTAYGFSGDKEKAIEAGCNDYISKPIKPEELLDLIKKRFKKKI